MSLKIDSSVSVGKRGMLDVSLYLACFYGIFIASAIRCTFGYFPVFPQAIKIVYMVFLWASFVVIPYNKNVVLFFKEIGVWASVLYVLLLLLGMVAILRGLFSTEFAILTFFGNEYTVTSFLVPLLAMHSADGRCLRYLGNASRMLAYYTIVAMVFVPHAASYVLATYFPLFWMVGKKYRLPVVLCSITAIYSSVTEMRAALVLLIFSSLAVVLVSVKKLVRFVPAVCCALVLSPIVSVGFSFINGESVFQTVGEYIDNDYVAQDTRTFLYVEMFDDLTKNGTLLSGRGVLGRYYSVYFHDNDGDSANRFANEVHILNHVLKAGLIYAVLYLIIIMTAIAKVVLFCNNRFLKACAVILSGWFMASFVSDYNGFTVMHLGIWIMLGCCLSNTWRSYSDDEIMKIINPNGVWRGGYA